jgi:hypothetical protein
VDGNDAIQNRKAKRMMLKNNMPNSLPCGSGLLMKSGPARESGATLYSNLADGKTIAVSQAVVSTTGSRDFCLTTVLGNAALPKVLVPHRSFVITHAPVNGEVVFIGDLVFGEGPLPRANIAWPASNGSAAGTTRAKALPPLPPTPPRFDSRGNHGFPTGTVIRVRDGYAVIQQDSAGRTLLGLRSQFTDTRDMFVGRRVTFQVASSQGKTLAIGIRSAR